MRNYCEYCGTEHDNGRFCAGCGMEIIARQAPPNQERMRRSTNEQYWQTNNERARGSMNGQNPHVYGERRRQPRYEHPPQNNLVERFKEMHPQRIALLIASIVGLLSLMLTWVSGSLIGSFTIRQAESKIQAIPGASEEILSVGTIIFVIFAVLVAISLLGKRTSSIIVPIKILVVILGIINISLIFYFASIINEFDEIVGFFGGSFSFGMGFYLAIIVILVTFVAPFLRRRRNYFN